MGKVKTKILASFLLTAMLFSAFPAWSLHAHAEEKTQTEAETETQEETQTEAEIETQEETQIEAETETENEIQTEAEIPMDVKQTRISGDNEFQGISEDMHLTSNETKKALWIKPENGKKTVAYCYDLNLKYPKAEKANASASEKTMYHRLENYLESNDEYIVKYGAEKKALIAAAVYAGYPMDGYHLRSSYPNITDNDARYVTQNMIWAITEGATEELVHNDNAYTSDMKAYSKALYEYVKKADISKKFELGWLELDGNIEFQKKDGCWQTDTVIIDGNNGNLEFVKLPSGVTVYDGETNEKISGDVYVGQSFYLKSDAELKSDEDIIIKFKFENVKFYFYTPAFDENVGVVQNLIQVVSANSEEELYFSLKKDTIVEANFDEFDVPSLPSGGGSGRTILYDDGFHYVKGSGELVFCMNNKLRWPHYTQDMGDAQVPEYVEGYLTEKDFESTEKYKEFMTRAKKLLYAGYPYNAAGLYELIYTDDVPVPTTDEFNDMLIPSAQLADAFPTLKHYGFSYPATSEQMEILQDFVRTVTKMSSGESVHELSKEAIEKMSFYKAAVCMTWDAKDTPMQVFAAMYGNSYYVTKKQAYDATQLALWKLLSEYGIEDNDIDSLNGNELSESFILFSKQGKILTHEPKASELKPEGNPKFTYHPKDGLWHSEPLKLVEPEGYNGIYTLKLPKGVTTVHNMSYVYGNEEYELVSDHPIQEGEIFAIEERFTWLKDFAQYSPASDIAVNGKKFQHMGGVVLERTTLNAQLNKEVQGEGSLSVTKYVNGEDNGQAFQIRVVLSEEMNGLYGDMEFHSGVATVMLKHGETKMAKHLPEGIGYEVFEVVTDGYAVEAKNSEGIIEKNKETKVSITNTPLASLTISKVVTGEDAEKDRAFTFLIEIKPANGKAMEGYLSYIGGVKEGYEDEVTKPENGELFFSENQAHIQLQHGQKVTFTNLPNGFLYSIRELEENQEGYKTFYNKDTTPVEGTLAGNIEVHVENYKKVKPTEETPSKPTEETPSKPTKETSLKSVQETKVKKTSDSPKTGDENPVKIYLIVMVFSLFGLSVCFRKRKA